MYFKWIKQKIEAEQPNLEQRTQSCANLTAEFKSAFLGLNLSTADMSSVESL